MAQRLSASAIDALAEQLVPGPPGPLSPSMAGTPKVEDRRGKQAWHGWAQRKAWGASAPVSVIGGTYGCSDQRITTEGWSPIKSTATGDDCLQIGSAQGAHFEIIGAVILPTHDGIAPSKGTAANAHEMTFEVRDTLFLGQRDEAKENDASLKGKYKRVLLDNTYMAISMRNPNNDAKMRNKGHTVLENFVCRFGAQPDPRTGNATGAMVPSGFGGGGLIFKAGSVTGTADYSNVFCLWNARHNSRKEAQGFRQGKVKDAFALWAPDGWKPKKFFMSLPAGWTDLGVHDNAPDLWFACVERWGRLYDCDPAAGRYGYAGVQKVQHVHLVREPWPYDWSYGGGSGTGEPPPPPNGEPPPPNGGPPPGVDPYPVKMSGKKKTARVMVPVEIEVGTEEAVVTMTVEDPDWHQEGELWHGDVLVATLFGGSVAGAGYDRKTPDLSRPLPAEVLEAVRGEAEVEMELRWLETAGFTVHAMVIEGKRPDEDEPEPKPKPKPDVAAVRKALLALQEQRNETLTVIHQVLAKEDAAVEDAFGALPEEDDD